MAGPGAAPPWRVGPRRGMEQPRGPLGLATLADLAHPRHGAPVGLALLLAMVAPQPQSLAIPFK
eukprot:8895240-Lingulodinium_polyedra.AAC.1